MTDRPSGDDWESVTSRELMEGLPEISVDVGVLVMKLTALATVGISSQALVLPMRLMLSTPPDQWLEQERLAMGLRESVALLRPHGPTALLAETLLSLSRCTLGYVPIGESIDLVTDAIEMLRAKRAEHRLARAYLELAAVLRRGGGSYDALQALEHAVTYATQHGDPGALSAAHYQSGTICRAAGLPVPALHYFAKSREALPDGGDTETWLERLASEEIACHLFLGREDDALAGIDGWLARGPSTYRPFQYRGDIHRRNGRLDEALADYVEGCVRAGAAVRARMSNRFRRLDTGRSEEIFDRGIGTALEARQPRLALGLAELANVGPAAFVAETATDETTLDEDSILALRIARLVERGCAAVARDDAAELAACQEQADWLLAEAALSSKAVAEAPVSAALVCDRAANLQAAMPERHGLLQFVEVGNEIVLFGLAADRLIALPTRLSLAEAVLLARGALHEIRGEFEPHALRELGAHLLAPAATLLAETSALTVLPCPAIHGVPFQAMPFEGAPLLTTHEIRYGTSGSGLLRPASTAPPFSRQARWTGLGVETVGHSDAPPLHSVGPELERIAAHFEAPRRIVSPPASSTDLFGCSSTSDILHLACHGAFEPDAPLFSHLLLDDRPVFAFEIVARRRSRGLVVLSACDTGRARVESGGFVQSLATAFLAAGAEAAVATLWPLDDRAAARAMESFYRHLLANGGASPPAALREAQLEIREESPHPYFWSSFAAFGEGAAC